MVSSPDLLGLRKLCSETTSFRVNNLSHFVTTYGKRQALSTPHARAFRRPVSCCLPRPPPPPRPSSCFAAKRQASCTLALAYKSHPSFLAHRTRRRRPSLALHGKPPPPDLTTTTRAPQLLCTAPLNLTVPFVTQAAPPLRRSSCSSDRYHPAPSCLLVDVISAPSPATNRS
jgi:hypothetical protein